MLNTVMEYKDKTLREKCPNTELFLVRIFLYSDWKQENMDQKKLRIRTVFTQWKFYIFKFSLRSWLQIMILVFVFRHSIYDDKVSNYSSSS